MTVSSGDSSVLKGSTADPLYCSAACSAASSCRYAFFRYQTGACYLQDADAVPGTHMITTWVGQNVVTEGGVTFRKYLDPPPPLPPSPPPPPPPTPAPTTPVASCWFFYPSGCSKDGIQSGVWDRDWWGESNANADTYAGCMTREGQKHTWCETTDIVGHFVCGTGEAACP